MKILINEQQYINLKNKISKPETKEGAGVLFYCKSTDKFLLLKRSEIVSEPNTWGIVSGGVDKTDKNYKETVYRECDEEIKVRPNNLIFLYKFKSPNFNFYNYISVVEDEFEPILNNENSDYGWFKLNEFPKPLHFGVKILINKSLLTHLDILNIDFKTLKDKKDKSTHLKEENSLNQRKDTTYINYYLIRYYKYNDDFNINTNNKEVINFVNGLKNIINELKENNIVSDDFMNPENLGYKPNGNMGYFDIGFGDYYEEFENKPSTIDLNELKLNFNDDVINKLFKKLNIDNYKLLNDGGAFGSAYDIGGDKVLKITTDKSEAVNSNKLINKELNYLSNIYDVKKIHYDLETYYIIILEKLDTNHNFHELFQIANQIIKDETNKHLNKNIINHIKKRHPIVGEFLAYMYYYGYDKTWEKYKEIVNDYPQYDFNDISEISTWFKDSKTNEHYNDDEPPQYIITMIKDLLLK